MWSANTGHHRDPGCPSHLPCLHTLLERATPHCGCPQDDQHPVPSWGFCPPKSVDDPCVRYALLRVMPHSYCSQEFSNFNNNFHRCSALKMYVFAVKSPSSPSRQFKCESAIYCVLQRHTLQTQSQPTSLKVGAGALLDVHQCQYWRALLFTLSNPIKWVWVLLVTGQSHGRCRPAGGPAQRPAHHIVPRRGGAPKLIMWTRRNRGNQE